MNAMGGGRSLWPIVRADGTEVLRRRALSRDGLELQQKFNKSVAFAGNTRRRQRVCTEKRLLSPGNACIAVK